MTMPASLRTVGWGLYCACSWTWVIGMFLPRLMLDRYGWPGFWVFLIPNVLGCSAFGYVLATRSRSCAFGAAHAPAIRWFSIATIAYHLYFAAWLATTLLPEDRGVETARTASWLLAGALAAGLLLLGHGAARASDRGWLVGAGVAWLASAGVGMALGGEASTLDLVRATRPATELAWLAPVIVLGFALCPALDGTFHRALRESPSRHAFAVFGLAFAAMLGVTLVLWFRPAPRLGGLALGHLAWQCLFTVGAHLRVLRDARVEAHAGACPVACPVRRGTLAAAGLATVAIATLALLPRVVGGERLYLAFLALYGLVFPAYVLVFALPRVRVALTGRAIAGFGAAVALAAPCYELGFNRGRPEWLAIPLAGAAAFVATRLARRPA